MVVSIKNQELSIKNVVFIKLKRNLGCVCVCVLAGISLMGYKKNKEFLCYERRSPMFIK